MYTVEAKNECYFFLAETTKKKKKETMICYNK